MKKCFLFMVTLIMVSCAKTIQSPEQQIEAVLKDIVIEKGNGMISDYNMISMEIDTVKISDIKAFIDKNFPKDKYPEGIPSDFKDEEFETFISPSKTKTSDEDIVYLSVKHKYSIFNPLLDKSIEVIKYHLLDPVSYKYIADDLRKDDLWMAVQKYEANKASEELDKVMQNF